MDRVLDILNTVDEHTGNLCDALDEYLAESARPVDEDSESRMRYARQMLVERWALAQGAVSKVAWVMRIDGNAAFERLINAVKSGDAVDMRGL